MNIRRRVNGHGILMCLVLGISVSGVFGTNPVGAVAAGVRVSPSLSLATGHAEVIAQTIVSFGESAYHWAVVHETSVVGADDIALSLIGPAFFVTEGGFCLAEQGGLTITQE